jgi:hypothetical protein
MRPALWNLVSSLILADDFWRRSKRPNGRSQHNQHEAEGLIVMAWHVQPFQISGGAAWLDSSHYDRNVQWTPDETQSLQLPPGAPALQSDTTAPSLFTALQDQLGLKSESQKGPVDTLIIERAQKPSEN